MPLNSSHAPETIPTHPIAKDCKPLFREGSTALTARMAFVVTGNWLVFPPNLCFLGRKQRRKRENEKKGGKRKSKLGPTNKREISGFPLGNTTAGWRLGTPVNSDDKLGSEAFYSGYRLTRSCEIRLTEGGDEIDSSILVSVLYPNAQESAEAVNPIKTSRLFSF